MNLGLPDPHWSRRAVCAQSDDPDLWISENHADETEAALRCMTCPVRLDCLDDAMDVEGGAGESGRSTVRGALTPNQRANLHRRTRTARIQQQTRRSA